MSAPHAHDGAHEVGHGHAHAHAHAHADAHAHAHPAGLRGRLRSVLVPHSHDPADSVDDAMEASAQGIRTVVVSLVVLGLTAAAQLAVVVASGSVALLADTVHNASDALTAVPLWIAFALGRRPPSRRYTYGLGRAEDLAGLFIVAMIALSAVVAAVQSVRRLADPQPLEALPWVLLAGVVGFAGNEAVAVYRVRTGRRIGSAALVADGMHARADGFTSLAVVGGVVGVWLGFPLADPLVGLLITAAILVLLWGTARDVGRRLLDGVDPALVDRAHQTLEGEPGVREVTEVRLCWSGHRLTVQAGVGVDPTMTVQGTQPLVARVEERLRHGLPSVGRVDVTVRAVSGPAGVPGTGATDADVPVAG